MPHVASVTSPYTPAGTFEISKDGRTAFATVTYTKRANLLPTTPASRCSTRSSRSTSLA